jgi:hypothetical protein
MDRRAAVATMSTRSRFARIASWKPLPILLLVVASVGLVAVQVPQHTRLSLYDEYVYYDYLTKVPTQLVVRSGEETGDAARRELVCRGVINITDAKPDCQSVDIGLELTMPYHGHTGADIYTPAYFVTTWVMAQPFTWFGIGLLDAGRLVGMVWLGGGVLMLYALMRRLGVGRWLSAGLGLGVISTPSALWATTYISTDAPALLFGAGAFLLAVSIWRGRRSPWWLLLFAAVAVAFKVQFIIPVAAAGIALVVVRIMEWRAQRAAPSGAGRGVVATLARDRAVWAVILAGVAGVAAQVVWMVIRSRLALPAEVGNFLDPERLNPVTLVQNVFLFLGNVGLDQTNIGALGTAFGYLLTMVTSAFLVVMIARIVKGRAEETGIAWGLAIIGLLMGPVLLVLIYSSSGTIIQLPTRYGIVLLPGFVLGVGLLLSRVRWAPGAITAFGGAAALAAILTT